MVMSHEAHLGAGAALVRLLAPHGRLPAQHRVRRPQASHGVVVVGDLPKQINFTSQDTGCVTYRIARIVSVKILRDNRHGFKYPADNFEINVKKFD